MLAQGGTGLLELTDIALGFGGQSGDLGQQFGVTLGEFLDLGGLVGRDFAERRQAADAVLERDREPVVAGGDLGPLLPVRGRFDAVAVGEAVLVALVGGVAVAAPDDPVDRRRRVELELRPARALLGGDPAAAVAVYAVVDEAGLVDAVAVGVEAGDGHLGAEGEVLAGQVEHLELVDAGFGIRTGDGEAHEPGLDGVELLLVGQMGHGCAQVRHGELLAFLGLLEDGEVGRGGAAFVSGPQDEHAPGGDAVDAGRLQPAPAPLVLDGG